MNKHTLDAAGKSLGRIASKAAFLLMGKDTSEYARNKVVNVSVEIINAGQTKIPRSKLTQKEYVKYSGYPGGLIIESLEHLIERRGMAEVYKRAVSGMLPDNKLKAKMIKNLTVTE